MMAIFRGQTDGALQRQSVCSPAALRPLLQVSVAGCMIASARRLVLALAPRRSFANSAAPTTGAAAAPASQSYVLSSAAVQGYMASVKDKYDALGQALSQPLSNSELQRKGKEYAGLSKIVGLITAREEVLLSLQELWAMEDEETRSSSSKACKDELLAMVAEERSGALARLAEAEEALVRALTPVDDDDQLSVVVEVRAGTGGDEASLFASEVFKMYHKYTLLRGWRWEQLSLSRSEIGGFKEAQASVSGEDAFKVLKFESGTHRVQRIPVNDVKIQTSAVTVTVLPEAEDVDVDLNMKDVRVDVFRAGGAGGQSVNKTESAVRFTHLPTGIVVSMQDERSQIQNRAKALKVLRARLYAFEREKMLAARSELRSSVAGTGDRSDKIRTYNFPQDRVTDHRVGLSVQGVERVLAGEALGGLLDSLCEADEKERLENFLSRLRE